MSGKGHQGRSRTSTDVTQSPITKSTSEAERGRDRGILPITTELMSTAAGGGSPTGPTGSADPVNLILYKIRF
jgi:hypothetical protein